MSPKDYSALFWASRSGSTAVVRLLLEAGADPSDRESWSPALIGAARAGHLQVVKLLLSYGADPDFRGRYGMTALQAAQAEGRTAVVAILQQARRSGGLSPRAAAVDPPRTGSGGAPQGSRSDRVR